MIPMKQSPWQRLALRSQKGQGITEYAVILAIVVGLGLLLVHGVWGTSLRGLLNSVGEALSGETTTSYNEALSGYGTLSNNDLMQISNEERIAIDQSAIRNLSSRFLGLTKAELKNVLNDQNLKDSNFAYRADGPLNQGVLLFDYYIDNTGNGDGESVATRFQSERATPEDMIQWMQGNYEGTGATAKTFSDNSRYLFSNDVIDPYGVARGAANAGVHAVSCRATFTFNGEGGTVDSVRTYVTRNIKVNGTWQRETCDGLMDIIVTQ